MDLSELPTISTFHYINSFVYSKNLPDQSAQIGSIKYWYQLLFCLKKTT